MTERDKYQREVGRPWEDVLNLILAQAPVDEVADETIPCLCKTLNQSRGFPGLEDLFDIVESPASTTVQLAALDCLADTHRRHQCTVGGYR